MTDDPKGADTALPTPNPHRATVTYDVEGSGVCDYCGGTGCGICRGSGARQVPHWAGSCSCGWADDGYEAEAPESCPWCGAVAALEDRRPDPADRYDDFDHVDRGAL